MTREELDAALGRLPVISGTATDRHSIPADRLLILVTAARERLAQLPEKCEPTGTIHASTCVCHGTGKVYPAELVERIARSIYEADMASLTIIKGVPVPNDDWVGLIEVVKNNYRRMAIAVLDALNGETE